MPSKTFHLTLCPDHVIASDGTSLTGFIADCIINLFSEEADCIKKNIALHHCDLTFDFYEPLKDDVIHFRIRDCLLLHLEEEWIEEMILSDSESDSVKEEAFSDDEPMIWSKDYLQYIEAVKKSAGTFANRHYQQIFRSVRYIFAINEGYGITTVLNHFYAVLSENGLIDADAFEEKVREVKLSDISGATAFVNSAGSSAGLTGCPAVLCLDCTELLLASNAEDNKKQLTVLLKKINDKFSDQILIFRVPYMEGHRLNEIEDFLNDVLNVRLIAFPPASNDVLFQYAIKCLKKHGFKVSDGIKNAFDNLIGIEKRDGRFYGFRTVCKLTEQIIYSKVLNAAGDFNAEIVLDDLNRLIDEEDRYGHPEKPEELIGLDAVKEEIKEILADIEQRRLHKDSDLPAPCRHMIFTGNPGCGKTTIARIFGQILREKGLLSVGNFYEISGRDLVGEYIGTTAPKTEMICRDARGSILFIDEAYTLSVGNSDSKDYGREALATLIAEMENNREDFIVIMAGYEADIEKLYAVNPGLKGRISRRIAFPNYTREELYQIFMKMVGGHFSYDEKFEVSARNFFMGISEEQYKEESFSNARMVRNLFERVQSKAFLRMSLDRDCDHSVLLSSDLEKAVQDGQFEELLKPVRRFKKAKLSRV